MSKSSWGTLIPDIAKAKPKEEPHLEEEEEEDFDDGGASEADLEDALAGLGDRMAEWAYAASEAAPDPVKAPSSGDMVSKAVGELATSLGKHADHSLEARVAADTALLAERMKGDAIVAGKSTADMTSAIAELKDAIAEAGQPKKEMPEAFKQVGDLLAKKIESVGTLLAKSAKNEGAVRDRSEKATTKAITGLTEKIAAMVKSQSAQSATAMGNMAQAITTLETRLETMNNKPVEVAPPRKPTPYRFTVQRDPETKLLESCVAEPLV